MNEQAIKNILEGVLRNVLSENALTHATPCPAQGASAMPACPNGADPIPVELSARHVHLSEQDIVALFGAPLTPARALSQPGEFLCKERVRLIGPKGVIDNVAILGPARKNSQVEISKTDSRYLGVDVPVRQSGDTKGTPGIVLASHSGLVALNEGLIVAARHIHMHSTDAARYCVNDKETVSVRVEGERPAIFENVLIRVSDNFKLAMHIDFDEGNGAGWSGTASGTIVAKNGRQ